MPHSKNTLEKGCTQPKPFQISIRRSFGITTSIAVVLGILKNLPSEIVADIGNVVLCIFFLSFPLAIAWAISICCKQCRADSASIRYSTMLIMIMISATSFGASVYCLSLVRFLSDLIPFRVDFRFMFLF